MFDDVALYSRVLSRDEISTLNKIPSLTSIPDTSVMCAGASRNFVFSFANSTQPLTYSVSKNGTVINANGTSATTTVNPGDTISLTQQLACSRIEYRYFPTVQGSSNA